AKSTVLKQAIEERTLADEKFRLAVDASPNGIVMADAAGTIVLVNAETERSFGYERDELIGQPVDILVPTNVQAGYREHLADCEQQPEKRRLGIGRDLFGRRKDGTEFPIEIQL